VASEPVIRPYVADDLSAVLDLLRRALGESPERPRTRAWFEWKHVRNPFGRSILLVAEAGRRLVGLRALMRWELRRPDGDPLLCARPVDTATDPQFRRLGIFRKLTLAGIEEAKSQGLHLLFNTPNPRSGAGYVSMGWQAVGSVGVMLRPKLGLFRRRRHQDFDLVGAVPELQPMTHLYVEDRAARGLRTPRTAEYQRWRFHDHPVAQYFVTVSDEGAAVIRPNLRSGRRELAVSEISGPAGSILRRVARSSDADYLIGWFSPGSPERTEAIRGGLIPVPWKRTLTLMARPLTELDLDVGIFSNWDLALGDLELL